MREDPTVPPVADEATLLENARAGSVAAFSDLVRLHQASVRTYVGRFVRRAEVANDVAQETFLTAFQTLASFREESPFRFWLLGIARRLVLSHLREEARRHARETGSLDGAVALWQSERLERGDTTARHERELVALATCLKGLPRPGAQIVSAHYLRGQSTAEIAQQFGKRESAVRMALTRLRRLLRACVERRMATERT